MPKNNILQYATLALLLIIIILMFTGNSRLKEAQTIIRETKNQLVVMQDSIGKAQKNISAMVSDLNYTRNELTILQKDREILRLQAEVNAQKSKAEREKILKELEEAKNRKSELIKKSKEYFDDED